MNTEHTPGPWTLHKHEAYQISYIVRGGEKQNQIAQCFNWQDRGFDVKSEANARLIAAAPDLLAALKDMLSLLGDAGTEDAETWQPGQNWIFVEDKVSAKNRITSARAAIAKAEGKA